MKPHEHYLEAEDNLKMGGDKLAALVHAILAQTPGDVIARMNVARNAPAFTSKGDSA